MFTPGLLVFFNDKTKIMQKSVLRGQKKWPGTLLKTLLVMKLAIIIFFATTLQVNAFPAMGQKVNLNLKQTEIKKVLKLIEDDGHYRFLFNSKLKALKNKTDFSAQNLTVSESLDKLFSGSNLTYKQLENNVVVVFSTNEEENDKIKV
ncbi:MAG TPA: hypothetical protein DCQ97_09005, partial [Chitinophagaceae bacterium]|nr:hypothetical protein [Chitinophagaceae bacterium]